MTAPLAAPEAPAVDAPASPASKTAVGLGVGGASLAFFIAERLLADNGNVAAEMLTRLSPLAGPVWASWPLLVMVLMLAWAATVKWRTAQSARASEAAAAAVAADKIAGSVNSLRTDLHNHADKTDVRLRNHEAGLAEVRAEVSHVRGRVDVLETGPARPTTARPLAPRGRTR